MSERKGERERIVCEKGENGGEFVSGWKGSIILQRSKKKVAHFEKRVSLGPFGSVS